MMGCRYATEKDEKDLFIIGYGIRVGHDINRFGRGAE